MCWDKNGTMKKAWHMCSPSMQHGVTGVGWSYSQSKDCPLEAPPTSYHCDGQVEKQHAEDCTSYQRQSYQKKSPLSSNV